MPLGSDSALQTMAAQQRYAKAKKQIEDAVPGPIEVYHPASLR